MKERPEGFRAFLINRLRSSPLLRDTITTTILSIFGKGAGFFIPIFVAAWFGVTKDTDAFFFSYGIILFLALLFSPAVESIVVPFIAEARVNKEDIGAFVGKVLGISLTGITALSLLFLAFIKIFLAAVSSFDPASLDLIFVIFVEAVPLAVLLVWTSVLSGTLNAYKIFKIPALSPAFRAIVTIGFIVTFKGSLGVHSIAIGYVLGEVFRLAVLFWLLRRLNLFRLRLSFRWDGKFVSFLKISAYQVLGMTVLAFTSIINKTMASWAGYGSVTMLEYAERLYLIPTTLLSSGILVALLSHWSDRYQLAGEDGLRRDVSKTLKIIGVMGVLLTIVLFFAGSLLVALAYDHGEFPKEKLSEVTRIFGFYVLGITPYFLCHVYSRACLTRKETKPLFYTAVITTISTITLNSILIRPMGAAGISLSSSIVLVIAFVSLKYFFERSSNGIS